MARRNAIGIDLTPATGTNAYTLPASGTSVLLGTKVTLVGDTNYSILSTDRIIATNAAWTASRTWTLPAASTLKAGEMITIVDLKAVFTKTNPLTIARSASDTFWTLNINASLTRVGSQIVFISDGIGNWALMVWPPQFIPGTTTNDNATAGDVGEYVESVVSNQTSPASGVTAALTSISLTAGDWDVFGNVMNSPTNGTFSRIAASFNTVSNAETNNRCVLQVSPEISLLNQMAVPTTRFSLASTTTIYLTITASYSVAPTFGGRISARRMR